MDEQSRIENGNGRPSYLDSLKDKVGKEDRRCLDWAETLPRLRWFLLGAGKGLVEAGTSLALSSDPHGMLVIVRTTRYGYEARYSGPTLQSILEQIENDLANSTVPWQPDWRRRKESGKRLDV